MEKTATAKADRRSGRTRQLLGDALVTLMQQKPYDTITVQDIVDRANVGRSTFYAHFQDKDDLLAGQFARLVEALSRQLEQDDAGGNRLFASLELLRHVQGHYHLYKAIVLWGRGFDFIQKTLQGFLSQSTEDQLKTLLPEGQQPSVPLEVVSNYVAGSFLTLLKWWLDSNMACPPERMDELYRQLVTPGVEAALGIKL